MNLCMFELYIRLFVDMLFLFVHCFVIKMWLIDYAVFLCVYEEAQLMLTNPHNVMSDIYSGQSKIRLEPPKVVAELPYRNVGTPVHYF